MLRECAKCFRFKNEVIANSVNHIVVNLYCMHFFYKEKNFPRLEHHSDYIVYD